MKKCFERPPFFARRMVMMISGVILQALGLAILIKLQLGTDPCSCLTQGVTNYLPLSFGTCQLICHLFTFAIVLRYDRSRIGFGTIGNMVCLGYIADFFGYIRDTAIPQVFWESRLNVYLMLIPALLVFILGAATYMCAGIGSSPYDAVPFIISEHVKKPNFKAVRMIWDMGFMLAGLLLGGDVGVVTVAVAFFLGPVITYVQKRLNRLLE